MDKFCSIIILTLAAVLLFAIDTNGLECYTCHTLFNRKDATDPSCDYSKTCTGKENYCVLEHLDHGPNEKGFRRKCLDESLLKNKVGCANDEELAEMNKNPYTNARTLYCVCSTNRCNIDPQTAERDVINPDSTCTDGASQFPGVRA